jgi:hypothetical protein
MGRKGLHPTRQKADALPPVMSRRTIRPVGGCLKDAEGETGQASAVPSPARL